jgi:hypothetical protein
VIREKVKRCRRSAGLRFAGMWLVVAKLVVLAIAAIIAITKPTAVLDAVGLGGLLPQWAALLWVSAVLGLCVVTFAAMACRRIELASNAMLGISLLVAANALVTVSVNGIDATWAASAYAVSALAFYDRSRELLERQTLAPPTADLSGGRR